MKKAIISTGAALGLTLLASTLLFAQNRRLHHELEIVRAELEQVREDNEKFRKMARSLSNVPGLSREERIRRQEGLIRERREQSSTPSPPRP